MLLPLVGNVNSRKPVICDTGAAHSFILERVLPLSDESVLVQGYEMGFVSVPLCTILKLSLSLLLAVLLLLVCECSPFMFYPFCIVTHTMVQRLKDEKLGEWESEWDFDLTNTFLSISDFPKAECSNCNDCNLRVFWRWFLCRKLWHQWMRNLIIIIFFHCLAFYVLFSQTKGIRISCHVFKQAACQVKAREQLKISTRIWNKCYIHFVWSSNNNIGTMECPWSCLQWGR